MEIPSFTWLHLTDLHFGSVGQHHLWPNVRDAFFGDLERLHNLSGPWDAVLFTGDLVRSGLPDQYQRLSDEVLDPLWSKMADLGSKDIPLLAVPGNHDLVRSDPKRTSPAHLVLTNVELFQQVAEDFWSDAESEYRRSVEEAFASYLDWQKQDSRCQCIDAQPGLLPGDFVASISVKTSSGKTRRVGIAGMNTSFLQLTAGDFRGKLAVDARQLHSACGGDLPKWAQAHDAVVLMSHHGPDWLLEQTQRIALPEIAPAGRFAVHIHGHMHENQLNAVSRGGGPVKTVWQSKSLFGTKKCGPDDTIERKHGYCVGRISFSPNAPEVMFWPRRALLDDNGWRFEPDHDAAILQDDQHTSPQPIVKTNVRLSKTSERKGGVVPKNPPVATGPSQGVKDERSSDVLASYRAAVCSAHRNIRFVEIPLNRDITPVELDSLFVNPRLTPRQFDADAIAHWRRYSHEALDIIAKHQHIVLLGDPGSGKSTLVSCIAWNLCRSMSHDGESSKNVWISRLGNLLPLPMILRELSVKSDVTWESLLESFLRHQLGSQLPGKSYLTNALKNGDALILLDGLDEIGNTTVRDRLRAAIHAGMAAYPKCRWVMTSRIVGYDLVPFDVCTDESVTPGKQPKRSAKKDKKRNNAQSSRSDEARMAVVQYLAPFDDDQILEFARKWYSQHTSSAEESERSADEFAAAVAQNEGTERLARRPYLLTLMTLIHHKSASLPHARVDLYNRIADAYLEQIDVRRHLDHLPYSLVQKKLWLPEVASRIQVQHAKKTKHLVE